MSLICSHTRTLLFHQVLYPSNSHPKFVSVELNLTLFSDKRSRTAHVRKEAEKPPNSTAICSLFTRDQTRLFAKWIHLSGGILSFKFKEEDHQVAHHDLNAYELLQQAQWCAHQHNLQQMHPKCKKSTQKHCQMKNGHSAEHVLIIQ